MSKATAAVNNPESGIEFRQIRHILREEFTLLRDKHDIPVEYQPDFSTDHGTGRVKMRIPSWSLSLFERLLRLIRRHFPVVTIKGWLTDDYRLCCGYSDKTALSEPDCTVSILGLLGFFTLEFGKSGVWTLEEAHLITDILHLIHQRPESEDPRRLLRQFGVTVYSQNEGYHWGSMAGYDQVKREVMESIILPFRHSELYAQILSMTRSGKFQNKGDNRPRAILFTGPPGVGKTTMARMIAHEVEAPLLYIPIETIISKYYGESSKNLGRIFDIAGQLSEAILFIDEIDSLAGSRDGGLFEATRRVLSVLLRYLDGFETKGNLLTIGATNRAGDLDPALISRFDHMVHFRLPDFDERCAILAGFASHLEKGQIALLSERTERFSGRNIKDLCEYAERYWAREIIQSGGEASPPPLEAYERALAIKIGSDM